MEGSNTNFNITPRYLFVDIHLDTSYTVIASPIKDCKKAWLLWPLTEDNLRLYHESWGRDQRLGYLLESDREGPRFEGGIIVVTDHSKALILPSGTLHSTLTTSGGLLAGSMIYVAQSILGSALSFIYIRVDDSASLPGADSPGLGDQSKVSTYGSRLTSKIPRMTPNRALHPSTKRLRHMIDAPTLCTFLRNQLDSDADHICTPLDIQGAQAALFKLTLASRTCKTRSHQPSLSPLQSAHCSNARRSGCR